jgi:predicted amidophosphoribosyltransferase
MKLGSLPQQRMGVMFYAPTSEPQKMCSGCRRVLPLSDFWKDATRLDGHMARCETCACDEQRPRMRAWRAKRGVA